MVKWKKQNMELTQSFHYYEGMEGNNEEFKNRSSGAYIFRPRNSSVKNFIKPGSYKIYEGNDSIAEALEDCQEFEFSLRLQAHW